MKTKYILKTLLLYLTCSIIDITAFSQDTTLHAINDPVMMHYYTKHLFWIVLILTVVVIFFYSSGRRKKKNRQDDGEGQENTTNSLWSTAFHKNTYPKNILIHMF